MNAARKTAALPPTKRVYRLTKMNRLGRYQRLGRCFKRSALRALIKKVKFAPEMAMM